MSPQVASAAARPNTPPTPNARHLWWMALALLMSSLLAWHSLRHVSGGHIAADARQNLTIAYNLEVHGIFSQGQDRHELEPSNLREPLPVWVVAAYLRAFDPPEAVSSVLDLASGPNAAFVKQVNALWMFMAVLGCWVLFHALTSSPLGAFVAAGLAYVLMLDLPGMADTLYTELAASALLTWSAWSLIRASRHGRAGDWWLAGAVLGLLALTKGIFLHASVICMGVMALVQLLRDGWGRTGWRAALGVAVPMAIGLAIVVGPWMLRNWVQFGSPHITEGRGGWVLYKRSLLNRMTDEEFHGAMVLYGPSLVLDLARGTRWEVTREDVTLRTGRYRRLNIGGSEFQQSDLEAQRAGRPDLAVTYYRQTSARLVQLRKEHMKRGTPLASVAADHDLQKMAVAQLKQDVGRHLMLTPLMAWRGFWSFPTRLPYQLPMRQATLTRQIEWLNLVAGVSLIVMFVLGLWRRNATWVAYSVAPLSMMGLYALVSQGLPRFSMPANPLMLMAFLALALAAWRHCVSSRTRLLPILTKTA
ncbi:MAG: hypothetical protein R3E99_16005 [Burkholderiaceae bacterium]